MQIKALSEMLGHSTVKITMDRYVHLVYEFKQSQITILQFPNRNLKPVKISVRQSRKCRKCGRYGGIVLEKKILRYLFINICDRILFRNQKQDIWKIFLFSHISCFCNPTIKLYFKYIRQVNYPFHNILPDYIQTTSNTFPGSFV